MSKLRKGLALALALSAQPAMADTVNCYVVQGSNHGNGDAGLAPNGDIFFGLWWTQVGGTNAVSLGGTSAGEPSALPGVMYTRGGNNELWEVTTGGTWTSLGGQITWNPTAVDTGTSTMVFYRGTNQQIWYREKVGGVWGPHTSIGGVATSSPIAVSWGGGHVAVFKRGQSNDLWYRERIGGAWGAWTSVGGSFNVDPTVVTRAQGYYDVFVRGTDNNTYWTNYNGQWNGWVNIDGPPGGSQSEPGAAKIGSIGLVVFQRGNVSINGTNFKPIYKRRTLDGGYTWTGWEMVTAQFQNTASNPEAVHLGGTYGYAVAASNATGFGRMEYCTGTGL